MTTNESMDCGFLCASLSGIAPALRPASTRPLSDSVADDRRRHAPRRLSTRICRNLNRALGVCSEMIKSAGKLSVKKAVVAGKRGSAAGVERARSSGSPLGLLALHLLGERQRSGKRGLIFIAENEPRAERLAAALHAMDPACDVLVLPRFDTLPFDDAEPSREVAGRRAHVLRRLAERAGAPLLISTVEAMLPRVPPPNCWTDACLRLAVAQSIDVEAFRNALIAAGYDPDEPPDYPGGVLFHGQTTELFPAGALGPVRIDHSGGTIDGIHFFDPAHHDNVVAVETLVIDPMSERGIYGDEAPVDLFACIGAPRIIADADVPTRADVRLDALDESAVDARARERSFVGRDAWQTALRHGTVLQETDEGEPIPQFARQPSARTALRRFIATSNKRGARILFTAATAQDLQRMERLAGLRTRRVTNWSAASHGPRDQAVSLLVDLERGFTIGTARPVVVITAADVLGSRAHHLQPMARREAASADAANRAVPGSAVIHLQRGLALMEGLELVSAP